MALPVQLQSSLSPAEAEFLAENERIQIEPLVRLPVLGLIETEFGPLVPPRSASVPLWLAIVLKKRGLCLIKPPRWLTAESLQDLVQAERTQDQFTPLPFHYMEVAKMLLEAAGDDLPDANTCQTLLQDLREARRSKARQGVEIMDQSHIRVDNLAQMELNELRAPFTMSFSMMKRLQAAANLSRPGGGGSGLAGTTAVGTGGDASGSRGGGMPLSSSGTAAYGGGSGLSY
ncbi:DNA replication protein psf2 [Allomyces arbusculus]|nr:DNA replication protein psf2 [Allomyces arbusculus]